VLEAKLRLFWRVLSAFFGLPRLEEIELANGVFD